MNVYAFDVDHTLDCSGGPVPCEYLLWLRQCGHVVGICGNFAVAFARVPQLIHIVNFFGQMEMSKTAFLRQIKAFVPADEYIMVGNDKRFFGESMDVEAAAEAGWRFIREHDFKLVKKDAA